MEKNDIYIEEFPEDAFFIKITRDGLFIDKGSGYKGSEIVICSGKIPGLVVLKDGSKIALPSRGKRGEKTSMFGISQEGPLGMSVKVSHDKKTFKIPLRKSEIPFWDTKLPLLAFPNAYSQVFPLGKISSEENWQKGIGYTSSILFGDFKVENKRGEIFEPFLLVLDEGVSVDEKPIKPFPVKIENGTSLSFLTLRHGTRPRLITIMKIKEVKIQEDHAVFVLDHPDTIAARLEPKSDQNEKDKFMIGNIESLSEEKIIQFRILSNTFSKYFAMLELDKKSINVTGPFLNKKFVYNQDIEIGNEDKFLLKVLRKETPGGLIILIIFSALVIVVFSIHLLGRLEYIILFGSLAILTTSRVLFAYTASTLPPFSNEAIPLSIFLLVFAPLSVVSIDAIVKALEWRDPEFLRQRRRYLIKGITSLLFVLAIGTPQMVFLSPMLLLGSIIPVLLLLVLLLTLLAVSSEPLKKLSHKIENYRKKSSEFLFKDSASPLNIILIAFILGRLALLMTGNKESVNIGARFSISIITIPLLILFIALCTSRFIKEISEPGKIRGKVIYRYIAYTFGFSAIFFGFAFITNDLGQMIFALPLSMFFCSVMFWVYKKFLPKERKHLFILAMPMVIIVLFLKFPLAFLQIIEGITEKEMIVKKISETDVVSKGQNFLRLMQYVAPRHLQEIGSRDSESVAQHYAIMNTYTRRGFSGEGYMNVKVHLSLYRTCLNDNVSAVYIFSQFGILGAMTIILAYGILVFISYRYRLELMEQENPMWRMISALSLLSILVIVVVSLYMIGANCNLLLFTGRNLYFFGLNSMSDIFESTILLGFITAGIAIGQMNQRRR